MMTEENKTAELSPVEVPSEPVTVDLEDQLVFSDEETIEMPTFNVPDESDNEDAEILESAAEEPEASVQSEEEALAAKQGWRPDGPLSAGEFLRRGDLFDKISSLNKEISSLKHSLEHQNKYMKHQQEVGYKKALDDLQQQRTDAILRGDVKEVNKLDEDISNLKTTATPATPMDEPAAVQDFKTRHADWLNDPGFEAEEMKKFVMERDKTLMSYNLAPEEHLKILEADLRYKYPHRFEKTKEQHQTSSVEVSTASSAPKKASSGGYDQLSPEQKRVCREFVKMGLFTKDEYIKQLKDLGEI